MTQINASSIEEIQCTALESCADTRDKWYIDCLEEDDACEMHCDGERACGYTLDDDKYSEYRVRNIQHLDCSDFQSCYRGSFELYPPRCGDDDLIGFTDFCCTDERKQSTEDGCYVDIDCLDNNACEYSKIYAHHTKNVDCDADACVNSNMTFIDPHPEFKLNCEGMTGKISFLSIRI